MEERDLSIRVEKIRYLRREGGEREREREREEFRIDLISRINFCQRPNDLNVPSDYV